MSKALILLGIAALLALLLTSILGEDETADSTVDGTRKEAWQDSGAEADKAETERAPTLKGSGTAAPSKGGAESAMENAPPEPTGPYEFIVIAFESEALLADVEITDDDGEPLGKTDEDGTLLIEDAGVSALVFRTAKDGYVTHRGRALPGRVTEVVLQQGVSIRGHVVHAAGGKPIADASIIVWDDDLEHEVASVSTDEEGRYLIRAVRPHHPMQLIVRTIGYAPHVQRELFHVSLKDYTLRVGDGGRLLGAVTTPEEKPLAGVEVRLLWNREPVAEHRAATSTTARALARLAATRTAVTRTTKDGMYEFLGVPLNQFVRPVAIVKPRFVVGAAQGRGHVFRDLDETRRLDIVVGTPSALRIRIEDDRRTPIGHAEVHLRSGRSVWPLLPQDAHEEGGYLIENIPAGTVHITASLPGAPVQQERVKLAAGKTGAVTLVFPVGRSITGVVKDKRGDPIWKARVGWRGGDKGENAGTRTDERGRFTLSRLESRTGTLGVSARDLPWTSRTYEGQTLRQLSPGPLPLEITLLDGTRAIGRFEDLPKGTVLSSTIVPGARFDVIDHHLKADGRFGRRGPRKGKGALFVFRTRGYPPLLVEEYRPFASEEVRDLGRLSFEATNPRLGRIVDESKRPLHGARVAIKASWSKRATRTDVVGDFAFPRLPDERIPIEIRAEGFPVTGATLETSSQFHRQVILIRRAAALHVEVFHPRYPSLRGNVAITVSEPAKTRKPGDPAAVVRKTTVRANQVARFHVPPGRYVVYARVEGQQGRYQLAGTQQVTVKAAPQNRVRVRLEFSK